MGSRIDCSQQHPWRGFWSHLLVTCLLFALFSKFLHRETRKEPGKAGEGCGKMLESERELRLLVEHIAVCVENVHSSYNFEYFCIFFHPRYLSWLTDQYLMTNLILAQVGLFCHRVLSNCLSAFQVLTCSLASSVCDFLFKWQTYFVYKQSSHHLMYGSTLYPLNWK